MRSYHTTSAFRQNRQEIWLVSRCIVRYEGIYNEMRFWMKVQCAKPAVSLGRSISLARDLARLRRGSSRSYVLLWPYVEMVMAISIYNITPFQW